MLQLTYRCDLTGMGDTLGMTVVQVNAYVSFLHCSLSIVNTI